MTRKTKKTILFSILLITITGMAFAFFMYNKKHVDVKNSSAIAVSATDLYNSFSKDSSTAKTQYAEKIVAVTGEITGISINTQQQQVILLKTASSMASVNCSLDEPLENIKLSDKISIKGICNGIGQGDPDLGILGDVYLTRCYGVK